MEGRERKMEMGRVEREVEEERGRWEKREDKERRQGRWWEGGIY